MAEKQINGKLDEHQARYLANVAITTSISVAKSNHEKRMNYVRYKMK